jgi:hypothetical protein
MRLNIYKSSYFNSLSELNSVGINVALYMHVEVEVRTIIISFIHLKDRIVSQYAT